MIMQGIIIIHVALDFWILKYTVLTYLCITNTKNILYKHFV